MSKSSTIVPKLAGKSSNPHFKYLLGILGLSSGAMALGLSSCANQEQNYNDKAKSKLNSQEEPTTISGWNAVQYPWSNNPDKNHEFDIVKMRGYFKEERFVVSREKDGRKGYAIFAPFITSHVSVVTNPYEEEKENPSGIMVNLGWMPFENIGEISNDAEPIEKLDLEGMEWGDISRFRDPYTNFLYAKEYDEDTEIEYPFTDVVGIVRRGEVQNQFLGNTNMPARSIYQYIDPFRMKRIFGFINDVDFDDHYLERMVDTLEDDDSYPIPATRNSFTTNRGTPEVFNSYASASGIMSAVSFAGLAALMLI